MSSRPPHRHDALRRLFEPRSIAVVGISEQRQAFGSATLANLASFDGRTFAINPRHTSLHGHAVHASLAALPEVPDCVFLAVRREHVEAELRTCIALGVGGVVVYASGYKETGRADRIAEESRLAGIVRGTGTRLLGPNCLGFVNVTRHLNGSFTRGLSTFEPVAPHAVGLISQSGAIGFGLAQSLLNGMALSHVLTAGNCCDVDIADEIAYLAEDDACRAIACLFEGTPDPNRLLRAGELAWARGKPLVICKLGVGTQGASAALSHTGSLAGSSAAWNAVFDRIGATVVERVEDLLEVAAFLAKAGAPKADGIAVLAASGGAAIICADKAEAMQVALPQPGPRAQAILNAHVPDFGAARNPCDATAMAVLDPQTLAACAGALLADPAYAALVMPFTAANAGTTPARVGMLEALGREQGKLVCVAWMAGWLEGPGVKEAQSSPGVALFRSIDRCFLALSSWLRQARRRAVADDATRFGAADDTGRVVTADAKRQAAAMLAAVPARALTEREAKRVLQTYGIAVTPEALAIDAEAAVIAANRIGYPVAMKVESADILHKTEANAVCLDVRHDAEVRIAFARIMAHAARACPAAKLDGVLVQAMVASGVEMLIGATIDPLFGPLITVALGGVFVELMRDSATELAPVSPRCAREMLSRLKAFALFNEFRGRAPIDLDILAGTVATLSEFASDHRDEIETMEINPLSCRAGSMTAVDALIVKRPNGRAASPR